MTDNEIKKALECLSGTAKDWDCDKCPFDSAICTSFVAENTLDYINRLEARIGIYETCNARKDEAIKHLEAENERLKSDVSVSKDAYMSMKDRYEYEKEKVEKAKQKCIDIGKALKNAKTEAYKECIEKVKEKSKKSEIVCSGALVRTDYTITEEKLDSFLK